MKLIYIPLEPYKARYTLQLTEWNTRVFDKRGISYSVIEGESLDTSQAIVTGQVLDAHGRSYYALSQIMKLVKMMKEGNITSDDVIFFEDMFHPGIEALGYIIDQVGLNYRPYIYARCLAQTIDPDDFVNKTGMSWWMKKYEEMTAILVDGILCASEEMIGYIKAANWDTQLFVTGLPFGKEEVLERVPNLKPFNERKMRVAFAARWDEEKQPEFFREVIREFTRTYDIVGNVEFALLSGGPLKSNHINYVQMAHDMTKEFNFKIYENLSKDEYYSLLGNSRVLFNCALQDWVSNTVSEADTLGTNVIYPAYRSFPEVFFNDVSRLYVPWSVTDAINKLYVATLVPNKNMGKISDYQNETINRTLDIMFSPDGKGRKYRRNTPDYRRYVNQQQY